MENRNQHVPEGWEITKLGRLLKVKYGKDQKTIESSNGNYPILGTGGIIGRTNTALYSKPSVLIGRKGSIDRPYYMDTPFWTIDTLFYTEIINVVSPKYIYYYFCIIDWRKLEESTGVPSLSATAISNVKIPLPPLPEQRAIAEILTAADRLIFLKERLIDAKHKQKLWLMQNLLTGKVRLKGFKKKWKEAKLGEICTIFSGGTPSRNNFTYWKNGTIKWLSAKCIENDRIIGYEFITEDGLRSSTTKVSLPNSIILVTRVSVGKIALCDEVYAINQDISVINPLNFIVNIFLFYYLKIRTREILNKTQGLAIKGITQDELKDINIFLPPLPEQRCIAEILSTADKELDLLTHELGQQKLVKKYLMQQLLTGRIRVKGASL
ncbi:MAG: restriction endonuclease subunit S [Holosporaceae bacterium]|jgi:type I restriction enzyme S subunit|nr:restriction endonuclease subunit S [Holosporaceae bacterium]